MVTKDFGLHFKPGTALAVSDTTEMCLNLNLQLETSTTKITPL